MRTIKLEVGVMKGSENAQSLGEEVRCASEDATYVCRVVCVAVLHG